MNKFKYIQNMSKGTNMKEIIVFLRDLSCNNSRQWFNANKQQYQ